MRGTRAIVLLLAIAVFGVACTGSSAGVAEPGTGIESDVTGVAVLDRPTEVGTAPTEGPTEVPVEVSDEEFEAAAVAAFEAEPQGELFAFDVVEAELQGTRGIVLIDLCGWDGLAVDDDLMQAAYLVETDDAGEPTATFDSIYNITGECTNTELVESALQTTRDYDTYWSAVLADPASFDRDEAIEVMSTGLAALHAEDAAEWSAEGLRYLNTDFDAGLPASSVQDLLTRVYIRESGVEVMEILACRPLAEDYGLYRGDTLVDDFRTDTSAGPDAVLWYRMVRSDARWLVTGTRGRLWTDCSGQAESFINDVNSSSLGEPESWDWLAT